MKSLTLAIISIFAFITLGFLSACDDEPSNQEKVTKMLASGTWTVQSLTVDGVHHPELFPGMQLTFAKNNTYTAQNGGKIWNEAGTWYFQAGTKESQLTISSITPNTTVTILGLTNTSLKISLNWPITTLDAGRSRSLAGEHQFVFTK